MTVKKKNIAIVLGSTKNYFFCTGTVVLTLKKFSPNLADDILIYYDDIEDRDREILVDELGCTLLPYNCPLTTNQDATGALQRFTLLSFSIYEIFKLLDEYHHVLWLDSDVCIQEDISDIINYGPVGIRYGGTVFASAMGRKINPAFDDRPTNNTGVVLVTDKLVADWHSLREQCYYYTDRFVKTLMLPDQAILNYVLWKNNIPITDLTSTYNYTVYHDFHGYNQARIFHLAHEYKFWNHSVLRNLFPIWEECYQKWLALGGSAYMGKQLYTEVGSMFSMQNMFEALDLPYGQLLGQKLIIDEQQKTIDELYENIESLLVLVENMKKGVKPESVEVKS
jgi:lipopolysaccharide biosynthesis glycosyltransferase